MMTADIDEASHAAMSAALAQRRPPLDGAAVLAAWKPLFAAAPWDSTHKVRGYGSKPSTFKLFTLNPNFTTSEVRDWPRNPLIAAEPRVASRQARRYGLNSGCRPHLPYCNVV